MACGGGTQRAMDAVEARSDQTAAEITKAVVARRLRRRHRLAEGRLPPAIYKNIPKPNHTAARIAASPTIEVAPASGESKPGVECQPYVQCTTGGGGGGGGVIRTLS